MLDARPDASKVEVTKSLLTVRFSLSHAVRYTAKRMASITQSLVGVSGMLCMPIFCWQGFVHLSRPEIGEMANE